MKLCINCQHYRSGINRSADQCMAPTIQKALDLVRGDPQVRYCELARENEEQCGAAAKLFVAVEQKDAA